MKRKTPTKDATSRRREPKDYAAEYEAAKYVRLLLEAQLLLEEDDKRERDDTLEGHYDDFDYARDVCQKRWGPL